MTRKIGARSRSPKFDTSLITVFSKDCLKEYHRQYHHLKTHPDCARVPPPSPKKIKKEVEKLRDMIHPHDAPNFEKTTKQEFEQARKELKKILGYTS
tara:strand:+ start:279 stop:569 length:291 start_codon:yes stop_codon:yes gene_type:complete